MLSLVAYASADFTTYGPKTKINTDIKLNNKTIRALHARQWSWLSLTSWSPEILKQMKNLRSKAKQEKIKYNPDFHN